MTPRTPPNWCVEFSVDIDVDKGVEVSPGHWIYPAVQHSKPCASPQHSESKP